MEFWRRKKKKGKARKCFLENGNVFLKELIADCNGISNPIRMFASNQIYKATNHFDPKFLIPELLPEGLFSCGYTFYKGVIDGRSYVIKIYTEPVIYREDEAYNDIVLSARVSNHISFLKLIGCCLEFHHPVMVFEDLEYKALNIRGSLGSEDVPVLPWNVRLKIAKEVATAITYLHIAFPRIIIHRDIKATNVFLDNNGMAKLTNFSRAVTLPEGKTWIEDRLFGSVGYLDPIYFTTGIVTEYSDVYSFGILMLVLLMGRIPDMDGISILYYVKDLRERGEPVELGGDSNVMRPGQIKMFLDLALRCCEERHEDRPKMISVAKEIKLIEQASPNSEMLENGSEDVQI